MPMDAENVRLSGRTGSDRRTVKTARLTLTGRCDLGVPKIRVPVSSKAFLTTMHGKGRTKVKSRSARKVREVGSEAGSLQTGSVQPDTERLLCGPRSREV